MADSAHQYEFGSNPIFFRQAEKLLGRGAKISVSPISGIPASFPLKRIFAKCIEMCL